MPEKEPPQLIQWQAIQAAMLYDFTSLGYLKYLHKLVSDFINGTVDPQLDLAKDQDRDAYLTDPVWGTRRTSENWANYGWPILKEIQVSIAGAIAARQAGLHVPPGITEGLRGIEMFSLEWTTADEEDAFKAAIAIIARAGGCLEDILASDEKSRIDDFYLHYEYPLFASRHDRIPRFRIRMDVTAKTGEIPPVTGVYITMDDPNATLQFAFSEGTGRSLRDANIFNDIGLAALAFVGRKDMWGSNAKMFAFATLDRYSSIFKDQVFRSGRARENLAPSAVANEAFTTRPATWHLVEAIEGHFDSLEIDEEDQKTNFLASAHRIVGGEPCEVAGFYFTPAMPGARRHFFTGELTPAFDAKYGQTFWQWDADQTPNR